ncbi:hypothetical protein TMatcc_000523 [Talaromyces marneffei ATCC 18224]
MPGIRTVDCYEVITIPLITLDKKRSDKVLWAHDPVRPTLRARADFLHYPNASLEHETTDKSGRWGKKSRTEQCSHRHDQ